MSLPDKIEKFIAEHGCLFHQPWWLNAVCVGPWRWDCVWIERGNEIAAVWPFAYKIRLGLRLLEMPPMTPYLGPILRPSTAKYSNQLSEEKELLSELIDKLPEFGSFQQRCHPTLKNWLPFHWNHFTQTSRITYRLPVLSDLSFVWEGMNPKTRTDIRNAEKELTIGKSEPFATFLDLYHQTFERQGETAHVSDEILTQIEAACSEKKRGNIIWAHDAQGQAHAACYIVWDRTMAYYLMGATDSSFRTRGAGSLCLWKAIESVSKMNPALGFDFEGSMVESIEHFIRSFGGIQTSYNVFQKTPSRFIAGYRGLVSLCR